MSYAPFEDRSRRQYSAGTRESRWRRIEGVRGAAALRKRGSHAVDKSMRVQCDWRLLVCDAAAAQSHTVTIVRDLDYMANVDYPEGKDRLDLYIPGGVVPVSGFFWVDRPGVAPDRPKDVWGTDRNIWIESSPSRYIRGDVPPVLLIDTDGDEEWRQQQNIDMAAALRSAGHKDVESHKVYGRTHMSVWTEMLDGEPEETSSSILRFAKRVLAQKDK